MIIRIKTLYHLAMDGWMKAGSTIKVYHCQSLEENEPNSLKYISKYVPPRGSELKSSTVRGMGMGKCPMIFIVLKKKSSAENVLPKLVK